MARVKLDGLGPKMNGVPIIPPRVPKLSVMFLISVDESIRVMKCILLPFSTGHDVADSPSTIILCNMRV